MPCRAARFAGDCEHCTICFRRSFFFASQLRKGCACFSDSQPVPVRNERKTVSRFRGGPQARVSVTSVGVIRRIGTFLIRRALRVSEAFGLITANVACRLRKRLPRICDRTLSTPCCIGEYDIIAVVATWGHSVARNTALRPRTKRFRSFKASGRRAKNRK